MTRNTADTSSSAPSAVSRIASLPSLARQHTSMNNATAGTPTAARSEVLPNVPTAREAGINYDMSIWAGLFAPKGVPPEVITRLADALDKALDEPKVRDTLARLGGSVPTKAERSPAAFDRFVRSEIARWAPILTAVKAEK